MIELRDLQVTRQTYSADFFIYFRYFGDDKVVDVVFTNATTDLHLDDPLVTTTDASGMTYKLYRVQGEFGEPIDTDGLLGLPVG